ncbi:hypothetical protein OHB00_38815 [Streptomyces sp. NBC_00631]
MDTRAFSGRTAIHGQVSASAVSVPVRTLDARGRTAVGERPDSWALRLT